MREGIGIAAVGLFALLCGIIALALGHLGGLMVAVIGMALAWAGLSDSRMPPFEDDRPHAPRDIKA
ncbi:MAG: hypothetical protein QW548_00855 [Candidatus Aenigmatarchaeota archaeon]